VNAQYLEPRVGDVKHSLADNTMARELLGYEVKVDLREGLKRTIDWWKSSRFAPNQG
jgi:UDP-glucose 4-epimerase